MPEKSLNSVRIAKNTLMLYVRMPVLMAIRFYTLDGTDLHRAALLDALIGSRQLRILNKAFGNK